MMWSGVAMPTPSSRSTRARMSGTVVVSSVGDPQHGQSPQALRPLVVEALGAEELGHVAPVLVARQDVARAVQVLERRPSSDQTAAAYSGPPMALMR